MKLIIAGGRDYQFTAADFASLVAIKGVTEVVSGGASGADKWGEVWARMDGIKLTVFPADWKNLGRRAGPVRNAQMARYADAVALFPGVRGTESMRAEAVKAGLKVFDFTSQTALML